MDDQAKKCHGIILYFLSQSFLLWILMLLLNCPRSMSCYALKGTELLRGSLIEACNNYGEKIRVLLIQCWLSPPTFPLSLLLLLFALFFILCILLVPLCGTSLG